MTTKRRRWPKVLAALFAVLVLLGLGGWQWLRHKGRQRIIHGTTISAADREAEERRVTRLGLHVPDGGFLLEHPYAQPFTSRSVVVPASWMPPMMWELLDDRPLKASDVLGDVEFLEAAMSRQYGGWDVLQKRGFDWHAFFTLWADSLRARGDAELSKDEAFAPMKELSQRMLDNHTQIPLSLGVGSLSRSWVLAKPPAGTCTEVTRADGSARTLIAGDAGEQPRQARRPNAAATALEPVWYLALPSRDGELKSITCGAEKIALARTGGAAEPSVVTALWSEMTDKPEVKRLDDSTVWFRLPEMSPGPYHDVKERKASWPKPNGHEKVLIVDVRGNGGGSADYGWQVLDGFIDRKRATGDEPRTLVKSCLYEPFRWNFGTSFTRGVMQLDDDDRADFQKDLDALGAPFEDGCPRTPDFEDGGFTLPQHKPVAPADGPLIIVWTDSGCGSDCEGLTLQLASLPGSWLVGTNTGGICQFIQPGYGVLPHTGLQFRFALGTSDIYGDGRSVDGHGLDVDVLLPPDEGWTAERIAKLAPLLR